MQTATSQNGYRSAAGTASGHKPYDEERLEWSRASRSWTQPTQYLRCPRPRRTGLCLLIIDILVLGLVVRTLEPLTTLLLRNEELFGARLTLSPDDAPNQDDRPSDRNMIPRILHQTSATEVVSQEWAQAQQSCKDAYADFEYKVRSLMLLPFVALGPTS